MPSEPVSTAPQAVQYLFDQLAAFAATQLPVPILVAVGEEGTYRPPDIILIDDEVHQTAEPTVFRGNGGMFWLNEEYTVDVLVSAFTGGGLEVSAANMQRGWELAGYVSSVVRADPSLGGLVDVAWPSDLAGGKSVWAEGNKGRICEINIGVRCSKLN